MKIDRELIKRIAKKRNKERRVNLSFSEYEWLVLKKKVRITGESKAGYVKRIYLTHIRSSETYKVE